MKTEAYFIPHCDNETCDLGEFVYTCPCCNGKTYDHEVWWEEDGIWAGKHHNFKCDDCKADLVVEWDKTEHSYFVRQRSLDTHDKDVLCYVGESENAFRCDCGCNVFRKLIDDETVYKCNSCEALYNTE